MSLRSNSSKGSSISRDGTVNSSGSISTKASSRSGIAPSSPAAVKRQANAVRGPWANGPLPLIASPSQTHDMRHPAIYVANEMTHQHNAALRGLNAIFLQAPHVTDFQDITDLLFLTQCWGLWVQYYDHFRRTRMFPKFEETLKRPGCILSQLGGNLDFAPSLTRLLQYVQQTHPMVETYDPILFRELIKELGLILQEHLATLISIVTDLPRVCGELESPEAQSKAGKISQIYRQLDKEANDAMDQKIVPPMLVRMRDTTFEGGNNWPGLSLVAVHTIADRLSKTHAGAWRFLPSDVWGKPKELPFLGEDADKGKGIVPNVMLKPEGVRPKSPKLARQPSMVIEVDGQ
ncbi:hypothetical protein SUNI508_01931 [Seiridium unicorne]|uniref:Uncharacterized protein n=1 Tax=Seiridium unicorne TaxID=138068 RepID=A0ABR2UKE2_9PEZI